MSSVSNDYVDSYGIRNWARNDFIDLYNLRMFAWIPSYSSPKKTTIRLLRNKFGDGYEQRVGDGINNIDNSWSLNFNTTPQAIAQEIDDYLKYQAMGESFPWVPPFLNPTGQSIKVICTEYQINPVGFEIYDVSMTFDRVFGE